MSKKPSYRELERQLSSIADKHEADLTAFRMSIEAILTDALSDKAHSLVGQEILGEMIRQVSYKEIYAHELKQWFDQRWSKRADFEGTPKEQAVWLGMPDIQDDLEQVYVTCEQEMTDKLIQVYQEYTKMYGHK